MIIRFFSIFLLGFFLFSTPTEAKNFKTPYQSQKSAYFKKVGSTGYFQNNESAWYEKPFEWTADGAKAIGNAIKDIANNL